jgi:hypothetical protein
MLEGDFFVDNTGVMAPRLCLTRSIRHSRLPLGYHSNQDHAITAPTNAPSVRGCSSNPVLGEHVGAQNPRLDRDLLAFYGSSVPHEQYPLRRS